MPFRDQSWSPLRGEQDVTDNDADVHNDDLPLVTPSAMGPDLYPSSQNLTWRAPLSTSRSEYSKVSGGDDQEAMELSNLIKSPPTVRSTELVPGDMRRQRRFSGWRMGVSIGAATAAIILLVNVILLAWINSNFVQEEPGIYTLLGGETGVCSTTKRWSTWLHLIINIASTLLLGASNYCMQCLVSPTRVEVDRVHLKGKWVDIGVPSLRNLGIISWRRIILWSLLGLSSVPLHLMFNSVVFESLTGNEYAVIVANQDFLSSNASFDLDPDEIGSGSIQSLHSNINNSTMFENCSNSLCIVDYSNPLLVGRRNFILITNDTNPMKNNSVLYSEPISVANDPQTDPLGWICSSLPEWNQSSSEYVQPPHDSPYIACDVTKARASASTWKVYGHPIEYGLSQIVPDGCKLQLSLNIMIVVIICNFIKTMCLLFTLWRQKEQSLTTVGDAIMSFLDVPDPTTTGKCLMSKDTFSAKPWRTREPEKWEPKQDRWFSAPSLRRWVVCIILIIIALGITIGLMGLGINSLQSYNQSTTLQSLWSLGFGAVNVNSLVNPYYHHLPNTPATLIAFVLISNLPQAILSLLYLMYNSLYTSMVMADEINRFAHERKPLRVTSPVGQQRSTYFLQLPYKYGIPLTIFSGFMHWLVSQSIFLARITVLDKDGNEDIDVSLTTLGFSIISIIFVIISGLLMVVVVVAVGFRRLKPGMPLVSSCSAAISAACHRPSEDADAAVLPVMWGVVQQKHQEGPGHCSITSQEVAPPMPGQRYAGYKKDKKE